MTKDELIARLRSLGEQLNRDVSLTGTKEELALRVAELKEELENLKNALVDYDLIFADNWATRASGYKLDEGTSSQLSDLFKAIKDVDYGLAEKLTDNLLSEL